MAKRLCYNRAHSFLRPFKLGPDTTMGQLPSSRQHFSPLIVTGSGPPHLHVLQGKDATVFEYQGQAAQVLTPVK